MTTAILDAARREALLSLLDDKSATVRSALLAYFAGLGADAAPFLREVAHGRNRVLGRHAAWYLDELKFSDPVAEFRSFIRSLNYELETGALLLAHRHPAAGRGAVLLRPGFDGHPLPRAPGRAFLAAREVPGDQPGDVS